MCLGEPLKDQKAAIRRMTNKQGYIRIWKKVVKTTIYSPTFVNDIHRSGLCEAQHLYVDGASTNQWGFHALRNKQSAENYNQGNCTIECLSLPEWVRMVGSYHGSLSSWEIIQTVTFTHLFFPTYPDRKPKVKDFWKAVKKAKVKS